MLSLPRTSRLLLGRARFAVVLACMLAACPLTSALSVGLAPVACAEDDTDSEAESSAEARPARHVPPPVTASVPTAHPLSPINVRPLARTHASPVARGPLYLRC